MINNVERGALRQLMKEDGWTVVEKVMAEELMELGEVTKVTGGDAFQTLKDLHIRQGKVDGIKDLAEKLEKLAS